MVAVFSLVLALAALASARPTRSNHVLHESREHVPAGWVSTGAAHASHKINMRIALPSKDFAGLEKALYEVSTPSSAKYGQHLNTEQVKTFMAPHDASVKAVRDWLSSHGIQAQTLVGMGDWLGFQTTVGKASELFDAEFWNFKHLDTGKEEVRTLAYSIPTEMKQHIELAHPMITFSNPHAGKAMVSSPVPLASKAVPSSCSSRITPACLESIYGIPTTAAKAGSKNSITVTGYIDQYAQSADLKSFLRAYRTDIASTTSFKLETLDGGSNPQGASQAGIEANLDVQYTVGVATGVPVYFLSVGDNYQDGNLEGFLDTVNFVAAESPVTYVMTTSYGQNENTMSRALATKLCNAYASVGAQGVSVLFASGDGGVAGSQSASCTKFVPTFPAGCPYLTSVGATQSYPETAAGLSSGGFSNYFGAPSYQSAQVKSYISSLGSTYSGKYNASGRGFPDVAAYGENVQIYSGGSAGAVAGTSCSSPIFASVIGLLNDALITAGKAPLGFLNPWLYSTAASALNDITSGSNPGCSTNGFSAKAGWDPVTGLGTPNFAKLKAAAGL